MKKLLILAIVFLAACKQTETTNTTTVTESSATVATVAPTTDTTMTTTTTTAAPTTAPPAPATATAFGVTGVAPGARAAGATPVTPNFVAAGADLFKAKNCAACHGASGAGDTAIGKKNNIHDFRGAEVQSQTDTQLVKTIREGKGPVSASAHKSKNLTADQAKSVVAWIRSLK